MDREAGRRSYVYGRKGRSALTCAWRQAAIAEHATYIGNHAVSALLDIERAFDSVDHDLLRRQAVVHRYDMNILRFLINMYGMKRIIMVERVVTKPVVATRSIVPGDSNADTLMLLCMLSPCDAIIHRFPEMHIALLADDIQLLHVAERSEDCALKMAQASSCIIEELENVCLLTVKTSKLVIASNSKPTADRVGLRYRRLQGTFKRTVRNLGVDFAAGGRVIRKVQNDRLKTASIKSLRMRRIVQAGAQTKKLLRPAILSGATYGVEVMGMLPSRLARLRTDCHRAVSRNPKARSATIELQLDDREHDPAFGVKINPILYFLTAIWDCILPRTLLLRAFSTAVHNVSVKRWRDVIGPFSAAAHSIVDCGWSFVPGKLLTWKDQHGTMIEVGDLAPRAVAKMLADSLQERLWNSMLHASTTFGNIRGVPWLTPIRRLLRAQDTDDWNQRHKNMLRCLASTGIWSLERLKCAGYRTDGLCKYCGAPQTLHHILWECEAVGNTVAQRRELPDVILHLPQNRPDWALWTTGTAKFDLRVPTHDR